MTEQNQSIPLLIISGPTAVGKTECSLEIARRLDGEIINADSMQIYRGMDIGTAKLPAGERKGIPHHLIDICDPTDNYDVTKFQSDAKKSIQDIISRNKIPILVGGTGFYIQAVLYDIDFTRESPDVSLRKSLEDYAHEYGEEALHNRLRDVDSVSADRIHPHNVKRVIRAIEYYETTGEMFSEHNDKQSKRISPYRYLYAVLTMPREDLYARIDKRVDRMIDAGLADEVKRLLDSGVSMEGTAMQGLGYKEIAAYLNGAYDFDEAVRVLKRDTRHYAKRQMTWFRREMGVTWFDKSSYSSTDELTDEIADTFYNREI